MNKKQQIIEALRAFMNQRSGIEFANYGVVSAFRSEQRSITKDLHQARRLLRDIELRDSITAGMILEARKHAYSGRLSIIERDNGAIVVDYCAGQYFPTEYRKAVAAVCASVLWDWARDYCMPEPDAEPAPGVNHYGAGTYQGMSAGDWLRAKFRKEYGHAISSRWFY